jgi:hypothetical protein
MGDAALAITRSEGVCLWPHEASSELRILNLRRKRQVPMIMQRVIGMSFKLRIRNLGIC